jgi:hypothetical protein
MSSIEKSGSNNSSPIQADFSVIIDWINVIRVFKKQILFIQYNS